MLNLHISSWEYFHVPFDYDATPLGPMGSNIFIHTKTGNRKSWDQHGREISNASPALENYLCFSVIDVKKKSIIITDTLEFMHAYIT